MPLSISPKQRSDWNSNKFTVVDGVAVVFVSVHKEGDEPDEGSTVTFDRKEFYEFCQAFTRLTPPTDCTA